MTGAPLLWLQRGACARLAAEEPQTMYLSRSPRLRLEELGDVCSALANRFARPSWKFRASSARAQNKGDQKRADRLQQQVPVPETLSIDSIEPSSGVATVAEGERGREGAREALAWSLRRRLLQTGGDCAGPSRWRCEAKHLVAVPLLRPGSHSCLMGPPR